MKPLSRLLLCILMSLSMTAFAQVSSDPVVNEITNSLKASTQILAKGDVKLYMSYWAKNHDVALIDPNTRTIIPGRTQISEALASSIYFPGISDVNVKTIQIVMPEDPNTLWVNAELDTTMTTPDKRTVRTVRWMMIRFKTENNTWKIATLMTPFAFRTNTEVKTLKSS